MLPSLQLNNASQKGLWSKVKVSSVFSRSHGLVSEKRTALQKISELNQTNSPHITSQGNAEFYSIENIKKRKALKSHPEIVRAIQGLWDVVNEESMETMSKDNFVSLMIRLHCLMSPTPKTMEEILILAEEDWSKDSGGSERMSKKKFIGSIFELLDIWTKSVNVQEYLELARRIVDGVAILDRTGLSGHKVLKDVRNIKFDPAFAEPEEKQEVPGTADQTNSDYCWNDDLYLAALQAQRGMWEYEMLTKMNKKKTFKKENLEGTYSVDKKSLESRESELLQFAKGNVTHQMMLKPKKVMKTVAKIYDAKIANGNVKELRRVYLQEEGDRFDRFVLLWHTHQFFNRQTALDNVRLLLRSVKRLAWVHPRLRVFAKMVGVPFETPEGIEEIDQKFKPHATSLYLFPFFSYFLKTNPKTGQMERLEDWLGSEFAPKMVSKSEVFEAAQKSVKYVPHDSPVFVQFTCELENICVNEDENEQNGINGATVAPGTKNMVSQTTSTTSIKQSPKHPKSISLVGFKSLSSSAPKLVRSGASKNLDMSSDSDQDDQIQPAGTCVPPTRSLTKSDSMESPIRLKSLSSSSPKLIRSGASKKLHISPDTNQEDPAAGGCVTPKRSLIKSISMESSPKLQSGLSRNATQNTRKPITAGVSSKVFQRNPSTKKQIKKIADVDLVVCLLLRVWDADYEWKQILTVTSAIVMMKRWIRRFKERKSSPEQRKKMDVNKSEDGIFSRIRQSSSKSAPKARVTVRR